MNEDMKMRPAKRSDIDQLVILCAKHAEFEGVHYPKEGKDKALENALFSGETELKSLVVEVQNRIIGYATFIKQFSTWDAKYYLYMDCLFINEESRGSGIGRDLLNKVKQIAKDLNCDQIQWQTPINNKRAIEFYRREGAKSKEKARFFFEIEVKS